MPVNVGNPDEISLKDFAEEKYLHLTGNKVKIIYKPLPVDDPKQRATRYYTEQSNCLDGNLKFQTERRFENYV